MQKLPKGFTEDDLFMNDDLLVVDKSGLKAENRLAAGGRGMSEDIKRRGDDRPHTAVCERIGRILHPACTDIGQGACTCEE